MKIDLSSITYVGADLSRPESVIATAKGELFVSDHTCGVHELGQPKKVLQSVPEGFLTNGIALTPQREFLVRSEERRVGKEC